MPVPVFTHPSCLKHDPGSGHPETPARLGAVLDRLQGEPTVKVREARPASREPLLAVHPEPYLAGLESMSARGGGALFLDTILSRDSWSAVLGGTGAVLAAVDHAIGGRGHAFAAIRPPGHHALAAKGMGFCLVNNVVVAARHAQQAGRQRVLIIDWDVHHGNGTQALVETDPTVRYVSLHQYPWYPGTGAADERGVGNVFNVPRGPGKPPALYVGDLWAAIVTATTDWDVHHGNGTQALIETDPTVRYVSLHQYPWYPGTGAADERGVGNVFNVPRGPGKPPALYVGDLWAAIVTATTDWTPDLVLVSAGFDAMAGDPLGGFTLEPEHYADWTTRLRDRFPAVPIVGMLEGGYVPSRLAEGVAAHLNALG